MLALVGGRVVYGAGAFARFAPPWRRRGPRDASGGALSDGPDGLPCATDPNGLVMAFNAAASRLLGYTPAEVAGGTEVLRQFVDEAIV